MKRRSHFMSFGKSVMLACGLISASALMLRGADDGAVDEQAARRERIAAMPHWQRKRLLEKHASFLTLPGERREVFRSLHRELEDDQRSDGRLREVLLNYHAWLKTLSPWQRAALRSEPNVASRMRLVRKYKKEQRQETDPAPKRGTGAGWQRPLRRILTQSSQWGIPKLLNEDLDTVWQAAEDSLPDEAAQILDEASSPVHRQLRVLQSVFQLQGRGPRSGNVRWPTDEQLDNIINDLSDEEILSFITYYQRPSQRREMFVRMLVATMIRDALGELTRREPSGAELAQFEDELREKGENAFGHRAMIVRYLVERQNDPFAREFVDWMRLVQRMMQKPRGRRGPRSSDRPGQGPPRGRDQFRGRGPGGRPNRGFRGDQPPPRPSSVD